MLEEWGLLLKTNYRGNKIQWQSFRGERAETSGQGCYADAADFIELQRAISQAHAETLKLFAEFIVYVGERGVLFRESHFFIREELRIYRKTKGMVIIEAERQIEFP